MMAKQAETCRESRILLKPSMFTFVHDPHISTILSISTIYIHKQFFFFSYKRCVAHLCLNVISNCYISSIKTTSLCCLESDGKSSHIYVSLLLWHFW